MTACQFALVRIERGAVVEREVARPTPTPTPTPEWSWSNGIRLSDAHNSGFVIGYSTATPTPEPTQTPTATPRPRPRPTATPRPTPSHRELVLRGFCAQWMWMDKDQQTAAMWHVNPGGDIAEVIRITNKFCASVLR